MRTLIQHLNSDPLQTVWRYRGAAVVSGVAMWWYVYSELPAQAIFAPERWGRSVTMGVTFGVMFGLVVLVAAEVPERLRGLWRWWARLLLSGVLGFVSGILLWIGYSVLMLYAPVDRYQLGALAVAGLGTAAAFALRVATGLPVWLATVWAAAFFYLPMELTWVFASPLLYTRAGEDINRFAIPVAILLAVGAYARDLISEGRQLIRRARLPNVGREGQASGTEEVER